MVSLAIGKRTSHDVRVVPKADVSSCSEQAYSITSARASSVGETVSPGVYTCPVSSSETAAVQVGAFADVSPIHDRRAKPLIAPVDFFGKLVAGPGLGDDTLTDLRKGLQQGVVKL